MNRFAVGSTVRATTDDMKGIVGEVVGETATRYANEYAVLFEGAVEPQYFFDFELEAVSDGE